jgi:hypothetical protein
VATNVPAAETPTSLITRTPRITATAEPAQITATPDPAVLFDDSFTSVNWAEAQGETWSTAYDGKRFHLAAAQSGDAAWSYRPMTQADVSIILTLQVVSGSGGVMVRYRDETDFVAVVIEPATKTYRILRREGATFNELATGTSDSIIDGDAVENVLTVTVVGTTVTLGINGAAIEPVALEAISDSARFGMIAIPTSVDADVNVDHITIKIP